MAFPNYAMIVISLYMLLGKLIWVINLHISYNVYQSLESILNVLFSMTESMVYLQVFTDISQTCNFGEYCDI